jgi:hypothetical protein
VALEEENHESGTVTIDWTNSDVRLRTNAGIPGPWVALGAGTTDLESGDITAQAYVVNGPCIKDRRYRLSVTDGTNTWFEYYPSPTAWTLNLAPHIDLQR